MWGLRTKNWFFVGHLKFINKGWAPSNYQLSPEKWGIKQWRWLSITQHTMGLSGNLRGKYGNTAHSKQLLFYLFSEGFSWWKLWALLVLIYPLSIQDDKWFEDIWLLSISSKNCLINLAQLVPCSQVSVRIKPNTYRLQGTAPRRVQIGSHWAMDLIPAAAFRFIPLWICPDCQDIFYIFPIIQGGYKLYSCFFFLI